MAKNCVMLLCSFVFILFCCGSLYGEEPPVIAAAADLKYALEEVVDMFKRQTGKEIDVSFGSAGNFYRQIKQGAPFQFFMSADEQCQATP